MDVQLSAEQLMLREALSGYLARRYAFEDRRAAVAGAGWRPDVWQGLAGELGLFGAGLPEADGGYGGGAEEIAVIAEELGRALVLEPYTEAIVVAGAVLGGLAQSADLLAAALEGRALMAPALYERAARSDPLRIACTARDGALTGSKAVVAAAPMATHLIVSAREGQADGPIALYVVRADAPGITRRDYRLIDGRPAADLTFAGTPAERLDMDDAGARACIVAAIDAGIGAQCAEAVGVMAAMLERTVAYANQREQFGRPIGTFQALQHRMADMAVALERARSMAIMATMALKDAGAGGGGDNRAADERSRAVSAAKAYVADALKLVAEGAVQVHGGIGTTDEIDVSHYFKRAFVLQHQFGTAPYHLGRMAALS